MNPELAQLGALAFVAVFTVKEYFSWQKMRKGGGGVEQDKKIAILETELNIIKTNHLVHIQADLDLNRKDNETSKIEIAKIQTKLDYIIEQIKK